MSLVEILIAMFIISVGLLGLAALFPVGRFTIMEAIKADRSADCGRAGLREMRVRRMLDPYPWPPYDKSHWLNGNGSNAAPAILAGGSFLIDPLGVSKLTSNAWPNLPARFGELVKGSGGGVPRITLGKLDMSTGKSVPYDEFKDAEDIFRFRDDLIFYDPEDLKPPQPRGRPQALADSTGIAFKGDYSWFLTVTPSRSEDNVLDWRIPLPPQPPPPQPPQPGRSHFVVSVVVCNQRDGTEDTVALANGGFLDGGLGGGSLQLAAPLAVKQNEWIALCYPKNPAPGVVPVCRWYRVVAVGDPATFVTVVGPDWDVASYPANKTVAVAIGKAVVGVYTTPLELDTAPKWLNAN